MIANRSDPWLSATLLVVAVATLGRALQVGDGILKPGTIPWLAIALAACVVGVLVRLPRGRASYGSVELTVAIVAALAWQTFDQLTRTPFNEVNLAGPWYARFRVGVLGAGLLAGAALLAGGWLRHASFVLLLVPTFTLGVSVIKQSREPLNDDVYVFQRDACAALSRGINPYTLTFPAVIGPEWYGEGLWVDGRLVFGYPYMPLTLLLAWPGDAVAGDYRYAVLAAMTLSAVLVAYARGPSVFSVGAAALLLMMPRSMYVLERGWSEPFVVLALAMTVFCAARLPRATPWVLGLLLASKQYVPFAAAAMLLLVREPLTWRAAASMLGKAIIVAMAVTLPFVLWDPRAFWHSAVALQFRQPFRWDSLSFISWILDGQRRPNPGWLVVPFVALALATAGVLRRCRHRPAGFAAGFATVLFAFFAFNKQAFANYYYLVIGALCCAVATAVPPAAADEE